jgi:hypothetical protein
VGQVEDPRRIHPIHHEPIGEDIPVEGLAIEAHEEVHPLKKIRYERQCCRLLSRM